MRSMVASYLCSQDFRQFLKFCIVGCSNMLVTYIVFYLCYEKQRPMNTLFDIIKMWRMDATSVIQTLSAWPVDGALANLISYSCGTMNSFFLNKTWTFKVTEGTWKSAKRFLLLNLFCLILSTASIFVFVDILKLPYKIIWFSTIGFVTVLNFLGNKHWTFKER